MQVSGALPLELTASSVEIRSRVLIAVVLRITGIVDDALDGALESLMRQAPRFFENAPIVLDLEHAVGLERTADFGEITKRLRARKLTLLGVQGWSAEQRMAAIDAGLVALQKTGDRPVDLRERRDGATLAPKSRIEPERKPGSLLILEPVRSGQVLFADGGDLVVVAPVSSGAELIAHGSIHVYGRMSGRALAGVNGDRSARIFCQNFDADLVAIAGLYRSSDDFDASVRGTRAQAFLEDDSLKIEPLR